MNRRKFLTTSGAVIVLGGLFGCASDNADSAKRYQEHIASVLISTDKTKLLVIGKDYHYIFDLPATLLKALQTNFHPYIQASISQFSVSKNNSIRGTIALDMVGAPDDLQAEAIETGFIRRADRLFWRSNMIGKRYKASQIELASQYRLNKEYTILVTEEADTAQAGPSPVGIVMGVIAIPGLIFLAFMVLVVCPIVSGGTHNCHE